MTILETPSLYAVDAFDPAYPHTFEFYYTGDQIVSNRAVIYDNATQQQIYDKVQDGLKTNHILPADTLQSGHAYTLQIQVYDSQGNSSGLSERVLFYCYSAPALYFSNANHEDYVSSANYTLNLAYRQTEGEPLSEYQYLVYDSVRTQVYASPLYHTEEHMSHTVYGLENNSAYYVRAVGKTAHGMSVDTGYVKLNIKYHTVASNLSFEAVNDPATGCINLTTNILTVGYDTENDNYRIENGEVVLENNVLSYETGADGDFCLIVKARKLPVGRFLHTTDEAISLHIVNIADRYYCNLRVNTDSVTCNIFREITGATLVTAGDDQLVDSCKNYIVAADASQYNSETMIVFEIYRSNNIYDLRASYHS